MPCCLGSACGCLGAGRVLIKYGNSIRALVSKLALGPDLEKCKLGNAHVEKYLFWSESDLCQNAKGNCKVLEIQKSSQNQKVLGKCNFVKCRVGHLGNPDVVN
jgi:hypothetical protein